jgi:hypothetical protein
MPSRVRLLAGPIVRRVRLQPDLSVVRLKIYDVTFALAFPIFSRLAPCHAGASPPSVRHRNYERQHLGNQDDRAGRLAPFQVAVRGLRVGELVALGGLDFHRA